MMRTTVAAVLGILVATVAAGAEPDRAVHAQAVAQQADALKLWERLVNIDSGTGDVEGLRAVAAIAVAELGGLGAAIESVPARPPAAGDNVVARLTGTGKGKVLLIAHMDTVFPKGTAAARPFRIEGNRARGPGVSDNKGGIVAAVAVLKMLHALQFKDYAQLTLLLNSNEETGSRGTRVLIETLAKEHDVTLNLESGRTGDGLVVWRKGSAQLVIEVTGRAAHAGGSPESGRNAAMELAHQVLQVGRLGDPQKQTTVNVTVLQSGDRSNVIPDAAVARADVRALLAEEFDRVEREAAELGRSSKLIADTQVKVTLNRSFPIMPQNAQIDALAGKAQRIYGELGRSLKLEGSGGAADSSLAAGVFRPTLDGLGVIGGNAHTAGEYAEVDSMVPRFYLLARMVMELGAGR